MEKIIFDVERLRSELNRSKNVAENYIQSILALLKDPSTDRDTLVRTLEKIKSGSKIVDYANFSFQEELIWLEVWKDASRLLSDFNLKRED